MTQSMWRMTRRTLNTEIDKDVFITEDTLKQEILQDMEFEYETLADFALGKILFLLKEFD